MKRQFFLLSVAGACFLASAIAHADCLPGTMASEGVQIDQAKVILVETVDGVMWYSGGAGFYRLRTLLGQALDGEPVAGDESGQAVLRIRAIGDHSDDLMTIGESTISTAGGTLRPAAATLDDIKRRVEKRRKVQNRTTPGKSITEFGHKYVLGKAREGIDPATRAGAPDQPGV